VMGDADEIDAPRAESSPSQFFDKR